VNKSTVFCSAAQRKFWNLPTNTTQTDCILFCRVAKNLGITNRNNANESNCILFCCATKIFGIYQQKQQKLNLFCSAAQRKLFDLPNKSNSN
jgi:hypothetical protein